jgi:hypothetical protein
MSGPIMGTPCKSISKETLLILSSVIIGLLIIGRIIMDISMMGSTHYEAGVSLWV